MLELSLTAEDVAYLRFGLSPLWEVVASVRVLKRPAEHPLHDDANVGDRDDRPLPAPRGARHQFGAGESSFDKLMAPLSQSDLPDIDYDRGDEKFVLRKNSLDPPYYTKLWKIDLG